MVKPTEINANDTYYSNAWHLNKMQLPTAWQSAKGDRVVVAILGSGVNGNHPDLAANMVTGWNSVSDNADTADIAGHGTKVAGTVAAVSDNANGVTSVAWHAAIMPVRVTNNSTAYAYWSDVANGLTWAAEHGAEISCDNVHIITVSATDSSDNKASWSNYGNCIDVAAPGVGIWTTTKSGGYAAVNGTSFASPATAGALAIIKSANPNLTNDEIETILKSSANSTKTNGQFSPYYGHGRVDVAAAVALAQ